MDEAQKRPRRDSDVSSHGTWDSDGTERDEDIGDEYVDVPSPLKVRESHHNVQDGEAGKKDELPAALRPGPANGAVVGTRAQDSKQYEEEAQSNPWQLESNNPYLQKTAPQNGHVENSQKVWEQPIQQSRPPQPAFAPPQPPGAPPPAPPVELPTIRSPTEELSKLSLGDGRKSVGTAASYETAEVLPVPQQGQSPLPHPTQPIPPALPTTNPWSDDEEPSPPAAPPKEALSPIAHRPISQYEPPPGPPPSQTQQVPPTPISAGPLIDHVEPARLPPISTQTPPAPQSPNAVPETPNTRDRRQRSEHYSIKHVNWFDSSSGKAGMRRSPILTQNANGPCPLLALVNALVLSTPQNLDTALVEALRTREQVSLGLLLDAVFDELMSGRRGDTAQALPDVGDLYAFLLALHTGMNVNPRFITPATTPRGSLDGHPPELHSLHPSERSQNKPGCFEETREMRLYSTFNIPLIHGWTAPKESPAYAAFNRSAPSFEDAQNIQFAEVELEDKLRTEGLSFQEQQTLEDIQTIKSFLQTWPTQLTDYGLETISRSLRSGQIAILFRNDHFSTLYKEPRHGALMTLVTDTGYSSHDEIVWESLVDVNGAASELFSGDFRTVSHGSDSRMNQSSSGGGNEGWQTVQSRYRNNRQSAQNDATNETPPPLPGPRPLSHTDQNLGTTTHEPPRSASEQEDHDLALALQLQEEEEDHQRQLEERRKREQQLSEQFLSSENERPPAMPPRRNQRSPQTSHASIAVSGPGRNRQSSAPQARPAVHRPAQNADPDAPPSYEQSASDRPYRPAGATAPPSQGNPLNTLDALRRQQSAYTQQSSTSVNSIPGPSPGHGRRASGNRLQRRSSQMNPDIGPSGPAPAYPGRMNQAATVKDTEGDKCVVM